MPQITFKIEAKLKINMIQTIIMVDTDRYFFRPDLQFTVIFSSNDNYELMLII